MGVGEMFIREGIFLLGEVEKPPLYEILQGLETKHSGKSHHEAFLTPGIWPL
ncbi:MAG: hypothetical protein FWC13_06470 [Oscillospiraceae bacterium]|nr:hypothetical protein [Oscillospiraceae bacterium]